MKSLGISRYPIAASVLACAILSCSDQVVSTTKSVETETAVKASTAKIIGIEAATIESEYKNQWTPELEAEFQNRAQEVIKYYAGQSYGNNNGENEKRSYPRAMFDFLAGNRQQALKFLQSEDAQTNDNKHTEGIDYYYSFTLKGQMRKYFLWGQFLDPTYKQRMFDGAKVWTETEPKGRPHPIYGKGKGGDGWGPDVRGGWVDGRNTDNLRAMREVAVYLMAEETGNEDTKLLYKQKIQRYVWALYNIGMGEWDSENYLGHTFAAYLNLYDFAKDPEVKQMGKAALDWMSAAAAVKYYRGGMGGPTKRDYGRANVVYGSTAARLFWLYFGDTAIANPKPEPDSIHVITSNYRPPQAIVALARKQFDKPIEIFSSKPVYENWKPGGEDQPGYWETTFFGNSYQLGSLAGAFSDGDVGTFKLMADNSERGVDYFVANTGGGWVQPGKNRGDQIGQYRNLVIWLRPSSDQPFFFQLPKTATAETEEGFWFFELEKTWLAVRPINLNSYTEVAISRKKFAREYEQERTLKAITKGNGYAGFALEVGEKESHDSYEDFKQAVKAKSKLNLSEVSQGIVQFTGTKNNSLKLTHNSQHDLPIIVRNGVKHNWSQHFELYKPVQGKAPIYLGWKTGNLSVEVGDLVFQLSGPKKP
ncbi:MAG: hypothetical protein F6K36_14345 [Symploca sp. SIO3C6]|nr:hypothetical protein [Symploca sp. SIO3C6]